MNSLLAAGDGGGLHFPSIESLLEALLFNFYKTPLFIYNSAAITDKIKTPLLDTASSARP